VVVAYVKVHSFEVANCNFNLSFHMPKSDTCKKCDTYAIQLKLGDVDDLDIRQEWDNHLASAEKTRAKLTTTVNESVERDPDSVITIDSNFQLCISISKVFSS